ncbi:aminopeptidase P N-terminal domain-containing protein [Emergencia sp. 1XD21-10]|uniref:aminopeptidase P N-terminal domain-containing protein n=1 Tax=Emergencia sp. 1XD21-10 TaxID=2304569 RepID=UPI001379EE72|nr:aminopeptidase P N-terminal domain-containing protein [Emergencia sp. 1XD21-10]NCF00568.1 M24 family metallopeptidase [Emergencia sp. 1XD21-10]
MSITREEYANRRKRLSEKLEPGCPMLLFSGEPTPQWNEIDYPFEVDRNFYYLTGIDVPGCILVMMKNGSALMEQLFVPHSSSYDKTYFGPEKQPDYYTELSGIRAVGFKEDFKEQVLMVHFMCFPVSKVYTGSANQALQPDTEANRLFSQLRASYPALHIENIAEEIYQMRAIKSEAEIKLTKEAIDITREGMLSVMKHIKPGMYEYEAEAYIDFEAVKRGSRIIDIIASLQGGENATRLHYKEHTDKLNDGDLLLMDIGTNREYYNSDVTRTIPVNGKFTEEQKHWYNIVLKAQEMIIARMGPGKSRQGINTEARKMLGRELRAAGLIDENQPVNMTTAKNWAASNPADHCIGLLCHDVGSEAGIFEPGMIFTVEPGVYLKDLGLGIRIEDDVLITETGVEILSAGIPKTVEEIEAIMKK